MNRNNMTFVQVSFVWLFRYFLAVFENDIDFLIFRKQKNTIPFRFFDFSTIISNLLPRSVILPILFFTISVTSPISPSISANLSFGSSFSVRSLGLE